MRSYEERKKGKDLRKNKEREEKMNRNLNTLLGRVL